jgi:hypothetical protein
MRVVVHTLVGIGDPDRAQQLDGSFVCVASACESVHHQRLGDVIADAHHGIERRHRLLKNQSDTSAAHPPHLLFGGGQ